MKSEREQRQALDVSAESLDFGNLARQGYIFDIVALAIMFQLVASVLHITVQLLSTTSWKNFALSGPHLRACG
jgi:hypothetical protein